MNTYNLYRKPAQKRTVIQELSHPLQLMGGLFLIFYLEFDSNSFGPDFMKLYTPGFALLILISALLTYSSSGYMTGALVGLTLDMTGLLLINARREAELTIRLRRVLHQHIMETG